MIFFYSDDSADRLSASKQISPSTSSSSTHDGGGIGGGGGGGGGNSSDSAIATITSDKQVRNYLLHIKYALLG